MRDTTTHVEWRETTKELIGRLDSSPVASSARLRSHDSPEMQRVPVRMHRNKRVDHFHIYQSR